MPATVWEIDGYVARLQTSDLRAAVDLRNPAAGLRVEWPTVTTETRGPAAALFELHIAEPNAKFNSAAIDFFVRGGDLVVVYAETPERPLRAEVYWRALPNAAHSPCLAGSEAPTAIELVISVQTSLLHMDPALTVATTLSAPAGVWRLRDPTGAEFAVCSAGSDGQSALEPDSGTGCFLFHGAAPLSYLEMVHPADFRHTKLTGDAVTGDWRLEHRLFETALGGLEKGVILRSRLRGMFVPRCEDQAIALAEYRRFSASEPPLTV